MTKLLSPILTEDSLGRVGFHCPGCGHNHFIPVAPDHIKGHSWSYNGDPNTPTFRPSLHVKSGHYVDGTPVAECWLCKKGRQACGVCHSFVTDGQIQFLGDCTHHLSGQTVPLPNFPKRDTP